MLFAGCRYFHSKNILSHNRKLSEIAPNLDVLALSNYWGCLLPSTPPPQKLYPRCQSRLAARHTQAKFRGVAPSTAKVVGANTLTIE